MKSLGEAVSRESCHDRTDAAIGWWLCRAYQDGSNAFSQRFPRPRESGPIVMSLEMGEEASTVRNTAL